MKLYCYLVTYDISSQKRWRKVFRTMHGYGEHVQLSVFRCDLTPQQLVRMKSKLNDLIHHEQDQIVIVKLGPSTQKVIRGIDVLGRPRDFQEPAATIV